MAKTPRDNVTPFFVIAGFFIGRWVAAKSFKDGGSQGWFFCDEYAHKIFSR